MKNLIFVLTLAASSYGLFAQTPFKTVPPAATVPANIQPDRLEFRTDLIPWSTASHPRPRPFSPHQIVPLTLNSVAGVRSFRDSKNQQIYALRGRPLGLATAGATKEDAFAYLTALKGLLGLDNPAAELKITEEVTDALGQTHLKLTQHFQGIEVYPAEARLHASTTAGFDLFTGRLSPTPRELALVPQISEQAARTQVQSMLTEQWIDLPAEHLRWLSGDQLATKLIIYVQEGATPTLAWKLDVRPNLLSHEVIFLDAQSGSVIHRHSHLCGFANRHGKGHNHSHATADHRATAALPPPPDGPYTTTLPNLYDQNQTINTFSIDDTYLLVDGSRDMFTQNQQGQIDGLIITYDGLGNTPQRDDFDPVIGSSLTNDDWTRTAVSVHANAGAAYQYFRDRHGRNSIDGEGGSVYSFMNINETDGTEMDNAFWNGRALFYGNGAQAFSRLPRALDVAGHEMAHGVIQSTANLVYENQPGALNESFADIFGYLVEGETGDYRIGEDVVVTNVFPSGAMRNLRNPNNGGVGPSDFRWQPAHMDDFQNLPNTQQGDNGGVHINSGIPNRAFYLFSSDPAVGDTRAERVYYRALDRYLSRSSQFLDLRIAVVQAAEDLYGGAVVAAANAAFNGVGIGSDDTTPEDGGDYTEDLETNEGDRFLLLSNVAQSALFRATGVGVLLDNPLETVGLLSRPSITDDGTAAVFIDDQNRVRVYNFETETLNFLEQNPQTIWRNVAVSKDGRRLALTTTDNDNSILIFDFATSNGQTFTLFNPTTANTGISTGDVQYADALEWSPEGNFLMYDALSRLDDGLEFWDIGFINVWNSDTEDFGSGNIVKLINDLPANISVGNPTFSKNSPYIIAFEEVDFSAGTYTLTGANIETGATGTIFINGQINYPNFGVDDDLICFDAQDGEGDVLAIRALSEDKITGSGNAAALITGGHWGVFYADGVRDLNTGLEGPVVEDNRVRVYPTVTTGQLTLEVPPGNRGTIQAFDAHGRLVETWEASPTQIDLSNLADGHYFLAIMVAEGAVIRKVVKQ
ncbi:MAG: M4 family metallopeptidase [Bacteroidota bacterium]